MKVFLIFLALLIVNVNMMVFHDDMRIYREIKESAAEAAENCAHGAAMYFDLESYAEGTLKFDTQQASALIDDVVKRYKESDAGGYTENINVTTRFFDEDGVCSVFENGEKISSFEFDFPYYEKNSVSEGGNAGAGDGAYSGELLVEEPSVEVFIYADIKDPFRQPFLTAESAVGYCVYANMPQQ